MNDDILKGKWMQLRGRVKQEWGKLTDDDVAALGGGRDELVGLLQERYGWQKADSERAVDDWVRRNS